MDNDPLVRALAGAAAIALLLLLVALRRRRAARVAGADGDAAGSEPTAVLDPAAGVDPDVELTAHAPVPEVSHAAAPGDGEPAPLHGTVIDAGGAEDPVEVRSLRAQVRTLEQALERLSDDPADIPAHRPSHAAHAQQAWPVEPALEGAPDAVPPPGTERYRRQVSATLRGLADRTSADEVPERTMARVVAAIERLESDDVVDRPVLPTVPAGTVLAAAARPAELNAGASAPRVESRVEPTVETGDQAGPESHAAADPAAVLTSHPLPVEPVTVEPVTVEPVGVEAAPSETVEPIRPVTPIGGGHRRTSRWSRHGSEQSSRSRS